MLGNRPLWLAAALLFASACTVPVPKAKACALEQTGAVVDEAGILSEATEAGLAKRLSALEQISSDQLVVATTKSMNHKELEYYSIDLARCWKMGRGKAQNGLLVLIAPNERKARIEVGRGLETVVKDEEAKAIMETAMIPHFEKGDYGAGVESGITAIITELSQDKTAMAARLSTNAKGHGQ